MSRDKLLTGMTCALILIVCDLTSAQRANNPPAPTEDTRTIVRSFDISDLVRTNSQYPYELTNRPFGLLSGRGRSPDQAPTAASKPISIQVQIDDLIQLIESMISTDSWRNNGGQLGQARTFGSILVVEQTKDNLDQIQKLLDELRKITGPTQVMTVRATWVLAQPGSLPKGSNEANDEWMSKQKIYCESLLTCFSGQTVHVSSGNDRLVATDLTPVVASNAVAFDPTIESTLSGIVMQFTPQIVPGSEESIIDVKSVVSQPSQTETPITAVGFVNIPGTGNANSQSQLNGTIDRGNIVTQELRTTARIPLKKRYIVGGMTLNPTGNDNPPLQLYLTVEVTSQASAAR